MVKVGLGAAIGAIIRYLITAYWKKRQLDWPMATLLINITGSFILAWLTHHLGSKAPMMLLFGGGVLGGYTTFSTLNVELVAMIDEKRWLAAGSYFLLTYLGGLGAALVGMLI